LCDVQNLCRCEMGFKEADYFVEPRVNMG